MKGHVDSPEQVVQRQLEAYNRRDIDAWLETYRSDAEQFELHGALLARGHDEMRARMLVRFQEPDLHAALLSRVVVGDFVIDHERITRTFADGRGAVEMLCIYEVKNGHISKASFAVSARL